MTWTIALIIVAMLLVIWSAYRTWREHVRPIRCQFCGKSSYEELIACSRADCPVLNYHDGPKTLQ